MAADETHRSDSASMESQAADWLARRDRGLTAAEQDEYLEWLRKGEGRGAIMARHEASLRRMMQLSSWQPHQSVEPNPDLFAPARRRIRWLWPIALTAMGAAAAITISLVTSKRAELRSTPTTTAAARSYLRVNERQVLADGSVVELRDGTRIVEQYSATERRVRLSGGEGHFTVAKDPLRPFVVEAGGLTVRALGTVFDVRWAHDAVDVLVTEGRVRVESPASVAAPTPLQGADAPIVSAGERATVVLGPATIPPRVASVTAEEIKDALAWKGSRLQFFETPLVEAVAEFNRHNRQQLVLGEPGLGVTPIGGTFRPDNIDGFVRLLEVTLGLRAEKRASGEIVLTRAR